jgi:hypothetical protein
MTPPVSRIQGCEGFLRSFPRIRAFTPVFDGLLRESSHFVKCKYRREVHFCEEYWVRFRGDDRLVFSRLPSRVVS